ncbi:DUF2256 domain-containing protein [Alteriqipengyuania sp. 357]
MNKMRKKWARDWDEVKYCSERCRRSAKGAGKAASGSEEAGGQNA